MNINECVILVCSANVNTAHYMLNKATTAGFEAYLLDRFILTSYREKVEKAYWLLADERSKSVYQEIVLGRIEGRYPRIGFWTDNAYFCWEEFTMKSLGTIFVDCGAYVGDTIERYIWKQQGEFGHIYGFEPDKVNYKAACCRKKRLEKEWNIENRLTLVNAGLGANSSIVKYKRYKNGIATFISEDGDVEASLYSLDDYLESRCDFIKADVESFEYEILLGATNIIKRYTPLLAICIYHNSVDLFSIINYINDFNCGYKFAVRYHGYKSEDVVLYAWIE